MKSWIFIGLLLAMMSGAVYYYYSTTQSTIMQLTENNAILEENFKAANAANEQNLKTIDEMQANFDKIRADYEKIQTEFQSIRERNSALEERFGNNRLNTLAAERAELIEKIINNASDNALRCFEIISGSPLSEKEKNATTAREFNSECPWLFANNNAP
jgi:chromosome segregation ATPase